MLAMKLSPHIHNHSATSMIMLKVALAMLPALAVSFYFWGFGTLIQLIIALSCGALFEMVVSVLKKKPLLWHIYDGSFVVTTMILALAIPPYSPFWLIIIGVIIALGLAKHSYGGLGQNLFNPAMVAYAFLAVSFPLQMTSWSLPLTLLNSSISFSDALHLIMINTDPHALMRTTQIDGISQATVLDSVKQFEHQSGIIDFYGQKIFEQGTLLSLGIWQLNIAFAIGGLYLYAQKIINLNAPVAFLFTFALGCGIIDYYASPPLPFYAQLLSGGVMFAAFFIVTDPVSAPLTAKGQIIFGALIGFILFIIRSFGTLPDGIAYAVLLGNICVPIIDHYTRPKIYGA